MKLIAMLVLMVTFIYAGQPVALDENYAKSVKCIKCHFHIVKEWKNSWHAMSHFENDEYFQKSIKYMARKVREKSIDTLQVQCAKCHNPRISITKTTADDEVAAYLKLKTHKPIEKAVHSQDLNEGINCAVCHNIDKIHKRSDPAVRGIELLDWLPAGEMSGPFDDARSSYHQTYQRDFMTTKVNDLCLVCHANQRSIRGFVFSDTEKEYKKQKNPKLCVDCHMSEKKSGIASTQKIDNGKAKQRMVRAHGFVGAHSPELIKGALTLSLTKVKDKLYIQLENPNPHNVPTGYGGREIIIDVTYHEGSKKIEKKLSLTSHYLNKRKKKTIPECAVNASQDVSIPGMGKKIYKVDIPPNVKKAVVTVSYRLVNDEIIGILKLKEPIWSKKMFVAQKEITLK